MRKILCVVAEVPLCFVTQPQQTDKYIELHLVPSSQTTRAVDDRASRNSREKSSKVTDHGRKKWRKSRHIHGRKSRFYLLRSDLTRVQITKKRRCRYVAYNATKYQSKITFVFTRIDLIISIT